MGERLRLLAVMAMTYDGFWVLALEASGPGVRFWVLLIALFLCFGLV